jgi:hypothetical protein
MIRRDYILRMIAEFLEVLSRLRSLKQEQLWREAQSTVEEQCRRLVGSDVLEVARSSETDLLARLIQGEPTQVVRDKVLMLTRLLKEAGDIAVGEGRAEDSRALYLKGLHLLLYAFSQGDAIDWPDFVPRVEMFVAALGDGTLPLATQAGLMQHYERTGQFGRAEDAFFRMLESEPDRPGLAEFGIAFFERIRGQSDAALAEGNLPRAELETALEELRGRAARQVGNT